jgi:hypothetical protein
MGVAPEDLPQFPVHAAEARAAEHVAEKRGAIALP